MDVGGDRVTPRAALRAAAMHLDRHRTYIELELDRRLGRSEPEPAVRGELVRRFRSFCRLASIDWNAARPSFDGLAGSSAHALERTIETTVAIATERDDEAGLQGALMELAERFRAGIRRAFVPRDELPRTSKRRAKRRPNAGKRVRAAIDRISDAYVALCLETGTVYDLNPAAETLFGGEADSLLRKEMVELIVPADLETYRSLEARLDAGEDSAPVRLLLRRLTGEAVPVELAIASHTIGGRRLAILSLRERTEVVQASSAYSTLTTSAAGIRPTREITARST